MQYTIKMSNQYSSKGISMIADVDGDLTDMIDGEIPPVLPILYVEPAPSKNPIPFSGESRPTQPTDRKSPVTDVNSSGAFATRFGRRYIFLV